MVGLKIWVTSILFDILLRLFIRNLAKFILRLLVYCDRIESDNRSICHCFINLYFSKFGLQKKNVLSVLISSPYRVDSTLTWNGWPRTYLNASLIGSNLNCQETLATSNLLVFSTTTDNFYTNRRKICSLYTASVEDGFDYCHFSCNCFYSQSCVIQFVYLNVNDEILCDVRIPDEHRLKEVLT